MMCVAVSPEINVHYDPLALIKKYEKEIKELKQELSMHDTLTNRSHVQYEAYTEIQKAELAKQLKNYVDNEEEEIEIINIRQIKEAFAIFRAMCKSVEHRKSNEPPFATNEILDSTQAQNRNKLNIAAENDRDDGVGEIVGSGFGIGVSPLAPPSNVQRKKSVFQATPLQAQTNKKKAPDQIEPEVHMINLASRRK
jgi:kinesin family protein 6/9